MVIYSYSDSSYPWSLFWSSFKTSQAKIFNWKRDNWNCCSQSTFRTLVAEIKASPHSIHQTSHLTKHMLEMDKYPLSPSQAYVGINSGIVESMNIPPSPSLIWQVDNSGLIQFTAVPSPPIITTSNSEAVMAEKNQTRVTQIWTPRPLLQLEKSTN